MLESAALEPDSGECLAQVVGNVLELARHTPLQNRLLAALPDADYVRLLPHLKLASLPLGWRIHDAGTRQSCLYFPTSGIVCRYYLTGNGESAGFAITGNEGVIGVAAILGGQSTPSNAVVISAGHAYALQARHLQDEFEHDGPLSQVLLRFTQALLTQTGQFAACDRHHALEQQLCRWILSCLDRLPSNELTMTQQRIADMLGVRREGVTTAVGTLQRAGLIRCSRGQIEMIDRAGLEARACECYAVVRREYDRLLPPRVRAEFVAPNRAPDAQAPGIQHSPVARVPGHAAGATTI